MRTDPFTHEEYEGRIVQYDCDNCGKVTDYEEDAYGQDFLVLCTVCSNPTDHISITTDGECEEDRNRWDAEAAAMDDDIPFDDAYTF